MMFERRIKAQDDRGAETGQSVLRFLAAQDLPATPTNYALGYLVVSNRDGLAARAVDAITLGGARLEQDDADRILAAHGPKPASTESDKERSDMRIQALRLAELAATAMETTGEFGRALAEGQQGAVTGDDLGALLSTMVEHSLRAERQLAEAARQIETLRQEVEAARGDAAQDALTGLLNRRGLLAHVAAMPSRHAAVLAICDVDRFKLVNDRYGHVVGDRVLKLVATSLGESCAGHIVARWGGEEFVVLIEGGSLSEALAIVDGARSDLAARRVRLRATDEPLGPVTFSAGIVRIGARSLDQALKDADVLLYRAKQDGRNRVLAGGEEPAAQ